MVKRIGKSQSDKFNSIMNSSLMVSILSGIGGFLVFMFSDMLEPYMGYIIGSLFVLIGINTLYKYFVRDGAKLYAYNLIFGIVMSVIGCSIILVPSSINNFVRVMIGLFLIIFGSNKLTYGIWFKIGNNKSWLITCVIALMLLLFGILVMTNPFSNELLDTPKLIGLFIILSSLLDFTDLLLLKNHRDEIVEIFW